MSSVLARRIAFAVIALALTGMAAGWWLGGDDIPSLNVQRGDLVAGVDVEGTLMSRDSSALTPPAVRSFYDFKISFMAPEGEQVDIGTPVLGFDTSELQRRLRDRETAVDEAAKQIEKLDGDLREALLLRRLQVAEAEGKLRRALLRLDVPEDLASSVELQVAHLDVEAAELEVDRLTRQLEAEESSGAARRSVLQAQVSLAQRQMREIAQAIEDMTVKAPRAGTVIYVTNYRGEKKRIGDSAWRSERIIELPNLRLMMARGEVDEADASRVAVDQPFRIRLDAHPGVDYTGTVESIWKTVQRKTSAIAPLKVIRLDLAFDEVDAQRMRPGMRFRGTIETERLSDVLMIPAHAVFPTPEGPVVYRRTVLGWEKVAVRLGLRNEGSVQLLEGLFEGDVIAETSPER